MNFSAISEQTVLGKLLRLPLRLLPAQTRMPIWQGRLKGKRWIVGSSNHGCWLGSFEYEKQLIFEQTVTKGATVFDVGAHVGFYTLLASTLVGPDGRVFAFEPAPRNLAYLREHLRLNRASNVTVIEAAVWDEVGVAFFSIPPLSRESLASSYGRVDSAGQFQVKTVSLDVLIAKGELPCPDYLKIDVEGTELRVLMGAKSMLAKRQPTIFLATHSPYIHQCCCQFLKELGYQLQAVGGQDFWQSDEILALGQR